MPELPEIETVKRSLAPLLLGRRILAADIRRPVVIQHPDPDAFISGVTGREIRELRRRGKYLSLVLDNNAILTLHLRMTGRLVAIGREAAELPHTHAVFLLDNGQELRFSDVRRFGRLWLIRPGEGDDCTGVSRLGPEPFSPEFSAAYLEQRLAQRKCTVTQALLDQAVVAGLGNIYADEALFAAGVLPGRPCACLEHGEWQALAQAIPLILESAISHKGTTLADYLDGQGRAGENQHYLQVYQRGGLICKRCGGMIVKTRIGGRGTCYCPVCQK